MTTAADYRADVYPTRSDAEEWLPRLDPVVWSDASAGPIDADGLKRFDAAGYLAIDELITAEQVRALRDELVGLCSDERLRADERTVIEPTSEQVRSIFEVHVLSPLVAELIRDERVVGRARQLLGSDVYVHQSRVNFKPGFAGKEFYWHSDFETWHAEDGMPRMRAVSISISLTDNYTYNGALMIMPGSHQTYVSCAGATPEDNYKTSLRQQEIGTPSHEALAGLYAQHGIDTLVGPAGGATMFDSNCMHGSNGNISPLARSNIFVVFNSVDNACQQPYAARQPRPSFIGARDFTPVR